MDATPPATSAAAPQDGPEAAAPAAIEDAHVFLPELWAGFAEFQPRKTALVCDGVRRDWAGFNAGMNRVANRLNAAGIGRGDRVAVVMANSVTMLEVMFGVVKAGACVVPLSAMLTGEQIAALAADAGARALFASAGLHESLEPHRDRLSGIDAGLWFLHGATAPGWQALAPWLDGAPEHEPAVRYDMEDEFNIIYSSGTTGLPKGIVQTHRARQHFAWSNALEMRYHRNTVALATTPLYSNGTFLTMLPTLFVGGTLVAMPAFDPLAFLQTVAREKVTHSFMVPTQFIVTLAHPGFDQYDLSSLEAVLSAGSPLRLDTKKAVIERMTPNLYEIYGISEGVATIIRPDMVMRKPGSVGTPVVGYHVAIIGPDDAPLPHGEVGEIVGYGAGMMKRYNRRPDATAEIVWRDARGRTYLRTGDIGRMDEDGYLYILDRKKDMIISGGFNIFPADLEQVIGGHPAVMDVTVIGVPHEKWGETPLALVIRETGAAADEAEILAWANERLGRHQRVSAIAFRDDFPRNALGKVLKRELREPYWRDA
ncbi:class I adenylate-forming enzyme family protein [Marinibaculum pumilum]|uniref:Class I adenylate-forming enzyme family protein n=1 Tax=Marinibaculum pumilum TaxID=1766165 RepID=A0ABV7L9P7_9PROT